MQRTLFIIALFVALLSAGCATKADPAAEPMAETDTKTQPQTRTPTKRPAVADARTAPAPASSYSQHSVAVGFTQCIDGVNGLGPVKLGMTVPQAAQADSSLRIDHLDSSLLSNRLMTLCNERVRDYKVTFDGDCRVRSIRFIGPARMERTFENICNSRAAVQPEEDPESAFKWRCKYSDSELSVTQNGPASNIYTLFRYSLPEIPGRCLLPRYME